MLKAELDFWGISQPIDSKIIKNHNRIQFFEEFLPEYSSMSLIWRGSRDGFAA